jgi:hypothetical protein
VQYYIFNHINNFHFRDYHFCQFVTHDTSRDSRTTPVETATTRPEWGEVEWISNPGMQSPGQERHHRVRPGVPSGPSTGVTGAEQRCRQSRAGAPPGPRFGTHQNRRRERIRENRHPTWYRHGVPILPSQSII